LDSHGNPVPIGVKGEIHIGGIGVARGYLNQSALTELRFSRNCFVDDPCARLYRTGDMGRYTPDGNLEFLGRVDQQVKIRGFRIELAEIESVLRQHPQVRDAVVEVADSVASTDLRLLAYVVNREDGAPSVPELRTFLLRRLPDYMVPTAFVILADLPRTPSGKVDRRALPVRETSSEELNVSYAAPRTEIERNIAAVWQELLGVERVGLNDNFFDLGGHSLLIVQVHDRLRDVMKINLSLVDLFRHPTINSLAESFGQVERESTLLDRAEERIARQMAARVQRRRRREARSSD
jgi:acyl carrier protein